MTEPVPLSIYLRIADARRHPFLALLFLATCREFLRNPIRQVIISAQQDDNLEVLRHEARLFDGLPIRFEVHASTADILPDEPCLIADPTYFFTRDTDLSVPFTLSRASGSLSFRADARQADEREQASAPPSGLLAFDEYLANNGLIVATKLPDHSPEEILRIQNAFRGAFGNRAFWNYRYQSYPALGSGMGSRGRFATLKRRILNDFIIRPEYSVLDVGCGDLTVIKDLPFSDYSGMDVSEEAIATCRTQRPAWTFHLGSSLQIDPPAADAVLCFDVLIHQPTIEEARALLAFLASHARRRIIVTGYDAPIESHHIVYFHAPLKALLQELDGWKEPVRIAGYHNMSVYVMDRVDAESDPLIPAFALLNPAQRRPLVTLTVTTFNNEEQIERCLDSIRRQTEKNIEVHVIDDGSTDGTVERIAEITQSDSRFQVVHDGVNVGTSARRNHGLRLGTGTYHMFVDGDDWLSEDAVGYLVDLATENGADIVRGSHMFFNYNGQQDFLINDNDQVHQPEIQKLQFSDCPSLAMLWVSWNNLIHRRVISENYLRFNEGLSLGEDRVFMLQAFMSASSITLTKEVTYFWDRSVKAHGSLSLSQNPKHRLLAIEHWLEIARDDSSIPRKHRDLIQVSAFYEAVAMMKAAGTMTEELALGYHRILETMDFPLHLLRQQSIKGWTRDTEATMIQIYEDLQRTGAVRLY